MKISASTYRIDPTVKAGLEHLSEVTKRSQNDLVNDALKEYVSSQSIALASEYKETARRLKAYRMKDPKFDKVIAATAKAEAKGYNDPAEGVVVEQDTEESSLV